MRLVELNDRAKIFHTTKYDNLYHLTDNHGFAFTIDQNNLKSMSRSDVSTTYDQNKNGVYGYSHYDFKFVLDAKKLISTYGGYYYDHKIQVGSERKLESLNEKEIRLGTSEVYPFNEYLVGTVLLFDLFSQKAIQWLLYDNPDTSGLFRTKSKAPRAIEALRIQLVDWKKPVWLKEVGRNFNQQEISFLRDVMKMHNSGGDFAEGMRELSDKYPIKDHWDIELDKSLVIRRQSLRKISELYNEYYQSRRFDNVDPLYVKSLFIKSLHILNIGNNISTVILGAIHDNDLFNIFTKAVEWGLILTQIAEGNIELALDEIKQIGKEQERLKTFDTRYSVHAGTRF